MTWKEQQRALDAHTRLIRIHRDRPEAIINGKLIPAFHPNQAGAVLKFSDGKYQRLPDGSLKRIH